MAEDPPPVRVQVTDGDKGLVWTADGAFPPPPTPNPSPSKIRPAPESALLFGALTRLRSRALTPTPLTPSRPQSTTVFARYIA